MIKHINFRASDIAPNPKEVFYWVDLQEDPTGGIIKYYDEKLEYWTTLRILEGSIVKVEERIHEWVTERLQEQTEWVEDQVHQFDGRITIIEKDIEDLQESKQDKLTAGKGIAISDDNVISCIISLYEIVEELPTENIDPTHIYIVVNPKGTGSNLHDEYVYLDGKWELLGQDLAPYALRSQLDKEIQDRIAADTALDNKLTAAISKEAQDRAAADTALGIRIDKQAAESEQRDIQLLNKLNEVENNLNNLHINEIPIEADTHIYGTDIQLEEIYPTSLEARTSTDEIFPYNTITDAIYKLDRRVGGNAYQIQSLQNTIGAYEGLDNTNYVSSSTSIVQAIKKLDAQLKPIVLPFALLSTTDSSYVASVFTNNFIKELEEGLDKSRMVIFFQNDGKDSVVEETYVFAIGSIDIDNAKNRNIYIISISAVSKNILYTNSFSRVSGTWSINSDPTHSNIITGDDVVNDLITNNFGKPLSAQQGKVLKDLIDSLTNTTNISKQELQELINALDVDLKAEIQNRQNADSTLDSKINTEITNRQSADQSIQNTLAPIKTAYDKRGTKDGMLLLGDNGLIPSSNLPSYVDDVLDVYATYDKSETGELSNIRLYTDSGKTTSVTPESGKIYIDVEGNYQFRWTGTQYVTLGSPTVIGTASGTAFDGAEGDRIRTVVDSLPKTLLTGSIQRQLGEMTIWLKYDTVQYSNDDGKYTDSFRTVSLPISSATSTYAGWMSALDKFKLDTNVVTLDEDQTITGKKTFKDYLIVNTDDSGANGRYVRVNYGSIDMVTNNGGFAGGLSWRKTADLDKDAAIGAYLDSTGLKYYYFGNDFTSPIVKVDPEGNITAKSFIKSGSSDQYVLLGGGGHKALNSFFTDLSSTTATNLSATVGGITKTITDLNARILASTTTTDLNALKVDGLQVAYSEGNNSVLNKPTNTDAFGVLSFRSANSWYTQILRSTNENNGLFVRDNNGVTWSSWDKILTESNYSSVADNKYVTLNTNQTITGQKTLKGQLRLESLLMFRNANYAEGVYFSPGEEGVLNICTHKNYLWQSTPGSIDLNGNLTMKSFKKSDGTSTQFLKADGSVDSNTYLTTTDATSNYVKRKYVGRTGDAVVNYILFGKAPGVSGSPATGFSFLGTVYLRRGSSYESNLTATIHLELANQYQSNSNTFYYTSSFGLTNVKIVSVIYNSEKWLGLQIPAFSSVDVYVHGECINNCEFIIKTASNVSDVTVIRETFGGIQGNAASATKLQTTKTLWGQTFDGTGNVSGNMSGLGVMTAAAGKYIDFVSDMGVAFYGNNEPKVVVKPTGRVGIGKTDPAFALDVNGAIRSNSYIYSNGWFQNNTAAMGLYNLAGDARWYWSDVMGGWYADKAIRSNSTIQGTQLKSTVATGTAPLTVNSTTEVTNLNAQMAGSLVGTYTIGGGNIGPSKIGPFRGMLRMMQSQIGNTIAGNTSINGYCDWFLMNSYNWNDVPYATAIGVTKTASPHAFIMSGPNDSDPTTWQRKRLVTQDMLSAYTLPTASATTLGGIKVGAGLTINSSGVLSATGGGTASNVEWSNITNKPSWLSSTVGSATKPIYLNAGTPTACGSSLAVSITGNASGLRGWSDTRSVATKPTDYLAMFRPVGLKTGQALGLSNSATDYYGVFGYRGYTDTTGDYAYEFALSKADKHILYRRGASDTWSSWDKLACMDDIASSSDVAVIDITDYLPDGPQAGTYTDGKGQALLRKVIESRGSKFISFILHNNTVTAQMYLQYLVADTSYETNTMIIAFGNYLYTFTIHGYNGTDYVIEETNLIDFVPDISEDEVLVLTTPGLLSMSEMVQFVPADVTSFKKLYGSDEIKRAVVWRGTITDEYGEPRTTIVPLTVRANGIGGNWSDSNASGTLYIEWTLNRVNYEKSFQIYAAENKILPFNSGLCGSTVIKVTGDSSAVTKLQTQRYQINIDDVSVHNKEILQKWVEEFRTIAITLVVQYTDESITQTTIFANFEVGNTNSVVSVPAIINRSLTGSNVDTIALMWSTANKMIHITNMNSYTLHEVQFRAL